MFFQVFVKYKFKYVIIDRIALAKHGDNALGSVHPSVCVFVSKMQLPLSSEQRMVITSLRNVCVSVIRVLMQIM